MPRMRESKILKGRTRTHPSSGRREHNAPMVYVRKFNGKDFESRPIVDMHRYKKDAEKAAENLRKKGFLVRITPDKAYFGGSGFYRNKSKGHRIWRRRKR